MKKRATLEPGVVVDGRYRIVGPLGEGGIGTVLIAEHVELGRRVALKVLQEQTEGDPSMIKRFKREARTLAQMAHPNIVSINDYGIWEGKAFLVMELLEGRTLRDLMNTERPLPLARAIGIAQQVLRALGYAHARDVIHRDLKPGNVFLQALPDHVDHVKLLDFGFAKFVGGAVTSMVTGDGMVVGTPSYMAPEQATPGAVDHRADVYAVGVLVFEMVAGRRPFEERDAIAVIRRRLAEDAPLLSSVMPPGAVSPELDEAVRRALARKVEDRWQSAGELAAALAKVQLEPGEPAPPPEPAIEEPSSREIIEASVSVSLGGLDEVSGEARPARVEAMSARPEVPWVWVVLAVGAALAVVGGRAWINVRPTSTPPAVPSIVRARPDASVPDTGVPQEPDAGEGVLDATVAVVERSPARDPWLRAAPPELLAMRRRILRGPEPTDRDLQVVAGYARNHRDDARATLLLGHGYMRARWPTGAIDRYEEAYGIDPESRGDPDMLANLIVLCSSPALGARAADRVAAIYGREALPAIDAAIDADPRAAGRLPALRARIAGMP